MEKSVPLAQYLFTRLRQLGVGHVHGVPGDYFLRALDLLPPSGLRWIGNCNELNAGYAADGYAKIKGISALMTTYGVGELSALNAVAGSYAEYAPVVCKPQCSPYSPIRPFSWFLQLLRFHLRIKSLAWMGSAESLFCSDADYIPNIGAYRGIPSEKAIPFISTSLDAPHDRR